MNYLLNFIKKHYDFILISFLLVFIQIICNFAIPKFTFQLIDTGVLNDGVTEKSPTVIRRRAMQELTNYMTKEDKNKVLNSYSFVNKKYEIYIQKYPILKEEAIYLLNGEKDNNLEEILENAILLKISDKDKEINKILPKIPLAENETLEIAFRRLTDEEKEKIINKLEKNKKNIPELTIDNIVNDYIKDEYKEVGFNLSSIKKEYITNASIKIGVLLIIEIIIVIYIIKKVSNLSLNVTKNLSKDILDKTSKLTYEEIKERDVKSLITKNKKDIYNLPKLTFIVLQMLVYIPIFSLLYYFTILKKIPMLITLNFVGIELFIILVLTAISLLIYKKFKKKKEKNILITIYYVLSTATPLILLMLMITGLILSNLKINYVAWFNMNIGEFLAVLGYTTTTSISLTILIVFIISVYNVIKSYLKINKLMKSERYIKEPNKPKKFRKNAKHFVEFKNVSTKTTDVKLSNINFKINANSIFGVLATDSKDNDAITKILLKLENIKSGNIIIDGIDINDVETKDLRTKIYCFYPKNVWYYEEDLESTKFLKSPDIYILNDFNNDLDLEKNEALNYFITKKAKNKIIIILSNNINNLMNVDKLAVIDKGKLVGLGKHKELIKTCKEYQKIINE